ncbi:MAG: glycosyltransferase [Patescibacteria group bacterium]
MKIKKIFYIANIRMPTERAHGIQVAQMCAAFARHGAVVTLLVPDRKTLPDDPFSYYGMERLFNIERLPVPDVVRLGEIGFIVESLIFAQRCARRARGEPDAIVYTREELPLLFLPRGRAFYEAHQLRGSFALRFALKRAAGIVAITEGLKSVIVTLGYPRERVLVAHDGYDEKAFAAAVSKKEARRRLGLSEEKKIALYIGGLEAWKGPQTLCEAAPALAKDGVSVVIIGGAAEALKRYRARYPLAAFLGPRSYVTLPLIQQAADVLIVPNASAKQGSVYASPLKLFAHMASGIPLVVSDVPAIREVLSESEAEFFAPDEAESLALAVRRALLETGKAKAEAALKKSILFTWDKRAQSVLAYIRALSE